MQIFRLITKGMALGLIPSILFISSCGNAKSFSPPKNLSDTLIITKMVYGFEVDSNYKYEDSDGHRFRLNDKLYLAKSVLYCDKGMIDSATILGPEGEAFYDKASLLADTMHLHSNNWSEKRNILIMENKKIIYPEFLKDAIVTPDKKDLICVLGEKVYIYTCL